MDHDVSSAFERRPVGQSTSMAWYRLPLLLLVLLILAAVAFLPTYLEQIKYKQTKGEIAALAADLPELKVGSLGKLFTLVGRKASPSVVHIQTEGRAVMRDDEYGFFLGPQMQRQRGEASGVIVDAEGYIVTNYHVIANVNPKKGGIIRVKLSKGGTYMADIVGEDAKNDLAVLKIEAPNLIPAPWGDSDQLQVGEMVWALGNPFGLDNSLTFGIVSAKARRGLTEELRYNEYLQTDAAVNPGNSGGPLVNMSGEIVGINTAIVGPTFQGISFAIPSNVARRIYEEIKETGTVASGFLGITPARPSRELAEQLGVGHLEGALIFEVLENSPAAKAGLEPGDYVIAWNGEGIEDAFHLAHKIARTAPETKATLTVIREGKEIKVDVIVGRRLAQER
jgi:S1-C subfamily serine protease